MMRLAKKNKRNIIIVLALIGIVLGYYVVSGNIYAGGYEVQTHVLGIRAGSLNIGPNTVTAEMGSRGGTQWTLDPDEPYTRVLSGPLGFPYEVDSSEIGQPDIIVSTSKASHVNWRGEATPPDMPVDTRTVSLDIDDNTNVETTYDLHLYRFTVTIKTDADKSTQDNILRSETSFDLNFVEFDGSVFIDFAIDPWEYRSGAGTLETWAGVLGASIDDITEGLIAGAPTPDTEASATAGYSVGSQVNMYTDFLGSSYTGSDFSATGGPDPDIRPGVVFEFGAKLKPGAKLLLVWPGIVVDLDVSDVWVKYEVTVEVLLTHQFTLYTSPDPDVGEDDPTTYETNRTDWGDAFFQFWDDVLANPLNFIMLMLVVGGIFIVLIVVIRSKKRTMIQ